MITTKDLEPYKVYQDDLATVNIKRPLGRGLPDEWKEKLGKHTIPGNSAYIVDNVHLAGPSLVGVKDKQVILDTSYFGRFDLWERNKPYWEMAIEALHAPPLRFEGLTLSLNTVWSGNYFHWMLDVLPRVILLEHLGLDPKILVHHNPPSFLTDSLSLLGIEYNIQSHPHYICEELLIIKTDRQNGFMHPANINALRDAFNPSVFDLDGATHHIYISRADADSRRLLNEVDLYSPDDLTWVEMDGVPLVRQMAYMNETKWIVGPHGAGLINMLWMPFPHVLELVTPAYTNPCIWLLAAVMGWDYHFVICEPRGKEDMYLNKDKFKKELKKMKEKEWRINGH